MSLETLGDTSELEHPPSHFSDITSIVQNVIWLRSTAEEFNCLVGLGAFAKCANASSTKWVFAQKTEEAGQVLKVEFGLVARDIGLVYTVDGEVPPAPAVCSMKLVM